MKMSRIIKLFFQILDPRMIYKELKKLERTQRVLIIIFYPVICVLWWLVFMWKHKDTDEKEAKTKKKDVR